LEEDNRKEKEECTFKIKELEEERDGLKNEAKKERCTKEEDAWQEIDVLVDKNKAELAVYIDQGMDSKADLSK